jgi:hypothetical protein
MQDSPEANTAIDVIRCVYLARMAEQCGNAQAAERWQQLADDWLKHHAPNPELLEPRSRTAS